MAMRVAAIWSRRTLSMRQPWSCKTTTSSLSFPSLRSAFEIGRFRSFSAAASSAPAVEATMTNAPKASTLASKQPQEKQQLHPTLKHIPKLPLLGSTWPWYSGIPKMDNRTTLSFWPTLHKQFGNFYTIGIPGLGPDIYGTVHIIHDPIEMARIVRQEGSFPSGAVEFAWPIIHYSKEYKHVLQDLMGKGPGWKRIRTFIQTDLLHPDAANRHGPAILEVAAQVSQSASHHARDGTLNDYLNMAAFSMFSNVVLGQLPRVSLDNNENGSRSTSGNDHNDDSSNAEDMAFFNAVKYGLRLNSQLMDSAYDAIVTMQMGYKTQLYKDFEVHWHNVQTIARRKVEALYEKRRTMSNSLTDMERHSYAVQAFERHEASLQASMAASSVETSKVDDMDTDATATAAALQQLTLEEVTMSIAGLLAAAVDTTSGLAAWKLLHIALSESTQEDIYIELKQSMERQGVSTLTTECLSTSECPLLHAAMREAHRLTNPAPTLPMKKLQDAVVVHGVTLPPGSVVALDGYTTGMRADIVGDTVNDFDPRRFLPDAVAARKQAATTNATANGTTSTINNSSVMDHPFFAGPFSQGARKCPGSRVANLEATALMAQLILDWRMTVAPESGIHHWSQVPYDRDAITVPKLPAMTFTARTRT